MGSIIVRRQPVALGRDVRTWHETGLVFRARPMRTATRAVVLHWTGGENGGTGVFETLCDRGLSVHFLVDHAGMVWQYCDANACAAHCGGANAWSIGIEVANRAVPKPHARWPREEYVERVHGRDRPTTRFYPAQVDAALELTTVLCRAFGIPLDVPRDAGGKLVTTALSPATLSNYRGVLGHYHVTTRKDDPGTEIMRAVAAHGGRPA